LIDIVRLDRVDAERTTLSGVATHDLTAIAVDAGGELIGTSLINHAFPEIPTRRIALGARDRHEAEPKEKGDETHDLPSKE
jgi:hypothetical protein